MWAGQGAVPIGLTVEAVVDYSNGDASIGCSAWLLFVPEASMVRASWCGLAGVPT